jgi:hypothetical protein
MEDGAWRHAAWNLALSGPLSFGGAADHAMLHARLAGKPRR